MLSVFNQSDRMFWFCDQRENIQQLKGERIESFERRRNADHTKLNGGSGAVLGVEEKYHNNLTGSLKAFQNKKWRPLQKKLLESSNKMSPAPTPKQRRPVTAVRRHHKSRPGSSVPARTRRPQSVPPGACRHHVSPPGMPMVDPGQFDTLSPDILANLLDDNNVISETFGEKSMENKEDSSSGSLSDSEKSLVKSNQVLNTPLRPEKLDFIYIPPSKRDKSRFDFDAEIVDVPPYEFKSGIPAPFSRLDFKVIAREKYDWRDLLSARPQEKSTEDFLDRLVEIEKHQSDTIEWESKRLKQRSGKQRCVSAKSWDKGCCNTCLQTACVGDCPEKIARSNVCTLCREKLCIGVCQETKYDTFMRKVPIEEQITALLNNPVPRICLTCQKKHNAKYINANNVILGRPKSGNTTFSHGQKSTKPIDMRPISGSGLTNEILREIECLGLKPTRPVTNPVNRSRSRNTVILGKTYSSNRKDSLTDDRTIKRRPTTRN